MRGFLSLQSNAWVMLKDISSSKLLSLYARAHSGMLRGLVHHHLQPSLIKRPIKRLQVLARQPLPPLRGPLVNAEGEARVAVLQLFSDVDRIVTERPSKRCVGAAQRLLSDRFDTGIGESAIGCPHRRFSGVASVRVR